MKISLMMIEQLKLNEIDSWQMPFECTLLNQNLLENIAKNIYNKNYGKKQKNTSLLELIDNVVVTSYINDLSMST